MGDRVLHRVYRADWVPANPVHIERARRRRDHHVSQQRYRHPHRYRWRMAEARGFQVHLCLRRRAMAGESGPVRTGAEGGMGGRYPEGGHEKDHNRLDA